MEKETERDGGKGNNRKIHVAWVPQIWILTKGREGLNIRNLWVLSCLWQKRLSWRIVLQSGVPFGGHFFFFFFFGPPIYIGASPFWDFQDQIFSVPQNVAKGCVWERLLGYTILSLHAIDCKYLVTSLQKGIPLSQWSLHATNGTKRPIILRVASWEPTS